MTVSIKRKNSYKSKSKILSKSKSSSNSRKHVNKSRKSGSKTRKMRGGDDPVGLKVLVDSPKVKPSQIEIPVYGGIKPSEVKIFENFASRFPNTRRYGRRKIPGRLSSNRSAQFKKSGSSYAPSIPPKINSELPNVGSIIEGFGGKVVKPNVAINSPQDTGYAYGFGDLGSSDYESIDVLSNTGTKPLYVTPEQVRNSKRGKEIATTLARRVVTNSVRNTLLPTNNTVQEPQKSTTREAKLTEIQRVREKNKNKNIKMY